MVGHDFELSRTEQTNGLVDQSAGEHDHISAFDSLCQAIVLEDANRASDRQGLAPHHSRRNAEWHQQREESCRDAPRPHDRDPGVVEAGSYRFAPPSLAGQPRDLSVRREDECQSMLSDRFAVNAFGACPDPAVLQQLTVAFYAGRPELHPSRVRGLGQHLRETISIIAVPHDSRGSIRNRDSSTALYNSGCGPGGGGERLDRDERCRHALNSPLWWWASLSRRSTISG